MGGRSSFGSAVERHRIGLGRWHVGFGKADGTYDGYCQDRRYSQRSGHRHGHADPEYDADANSHAHAYSDAVANRDANADADAQPQAEAQASVGHRPAANSPGRSRRDRS